MTQIRCPWYREGDGELYLDTDTDMLLRIRSRNTFVPLLLRNFAQTIYA